MLRELDVKEITEKVRDLCIQANHFLSDDMKKALKNAESNENSELGRKILGQLQDNGSFLSGNWTGSASYRWKSD